MGTTSSHEARRPRGIFISYTREDIAYAGKLYEHLHFHHTQHEGAVFFDKDRIESGDQWGLKIDRAIQDCSLFVVLLSARYFNSSYAYPKEFGEIGKRYGEPGVRILPVVVSSCNWSDYPINDAAGIPRLGQLDALGPYTKDGRELLALDQLTPAEQEAQWSRMAEKLCEFACGMREPVAESKLKKHEPRFEKKPIQVPAITCASFVDRSREVKLCRDALDGPATVLACIVAGTKRDWPEALALRLQASAKGNTLRPDERISIDWPAAIKKTSDARLERLHTQIKEHVTDGRDVHSFSDADVRAVLGGMIQRGGRRLVVSYLIEASDWRTEDKDVINRHVDWWTDIVGGQGQTQVILLLSIIRSEPEAKSKWWPFGRKPSDLSAVDLKAVIPSAVSLMDPHERLQPIVRDHISDWIAELHKDLKVSPLACAMLHDVGESIFEELKSVELPHQVFKDRIAYKPDRAALFEDAC